MSTSPDQPLPSAPKSPLSGASIPAAPAPAPATSPAESALPKSAYKVTRSPFSPKIAGGTAGPLSGPMALGSPGSFETAPGGGIPVARKTVSASGKIVAQESSALVVLDLIAAGVAIAAAVMIAMSLYKT